MLKNFNFLSLVDFTKCEEFSNTFPEEGLKSLINHYPNIFDTNRLKNELSIAYNDDSFHNISLENALIYLQNNDLQDVFYETNKLFSLILTIPSTSVSVERNFSALKRIKTYLRNSMTQNRLSALALISIEKDLLVELSRKENFYDNIIDQFARTKERRIDLIYK